MSQLSTADVSVVIPCYQCADTIERAVQSVAAQTMQPAEVILVEDCSGDQTLETLYALQRRYREGWIKVIGQVENRGPGEARNVGWEMASHRYIAFLDADDSWHPQKIEIQYSWMCRHPELALTGHESRQLEDDEALFNTKNFDLNKALFNFVNKNQLLWSNRFPTRSVMLRRDLDARFLKGKYHSEDYLLWLTIVCSGRSIAKCPLVLAYFYKDPFGSGGLSKQLWNMQKGQIDTYTRVWKMGGVSLLKYLFLILWSGARFVRRFIITRLRVLGF